MDARRRLLLLMLFGMGGIPFASVKACDDEVVSHQDLSVFLDEAGRKRPIRTKEDWQRRRRQILANMERVMGHLPDRRPTVPLKMQVLEETRIGGLRRQKVEYQTEPRDQVRAYLFLPADDNKKKPAVLCLHQTVTIGKDEPSGLGGNPNLHYALHLAQRGYVTLAPDYPSFGEHEFEFAETQSGYQSGSMKAICDNMRAIDLLQSLPQVDADRIGCIGHSLGGHNTMFTAVFDQRIKVMVSNCGFTRFHKYYGGKLVGWTSARYMPRIATMFANDPDQVPFDFPEIVACFAPRPFLASAPLHDDNFEVSGVRDSIAAAKSIYELLGHKDNLQANYPDCAHDFPLDARSLAYDFFDRHLAQGLAGE